MTYTQKKPTSLCGDCTICCRILTVEDIPGGPKPANTPCRWLHKPESGCSGCSIYEQRPLECQRFECHYIKLARRPDLTTSPDLRPDNSGVMLVQLPNRIHFIAHVYDPLNRNAWQSIDPPVHAMINQLVHEGFKVIISWGAGAQLLLETDGQGGIMESTLPPMEERLKDLLHEAEELEETSSEQYAGKE